MTVETRYFRNAQSLVNGLTCYELKTTNTTTGTALSLNTWSYMGIRVWKRSSGGVETEITDGACVAIINAWTATIAEKSATWNCPETGLETTDSIVVRVYGCNATGTNMELFATFQTEQLGAQILNAATWTVYYWGSRVYDPETKLYYLNFYWGGLYAGYTFTSRITNFTWSAVAPPPAPVRVGSVLLMWQRMGLIREVIVWPRLGSRFSSALRRSTTKCVQTARK